MITMSCQHYVVEDATGVTSIASLNVISGRKKVEFLELQDLVKRMSRSWKQEAVHAEYSSEVQKMYPQRDDYFDNAGDAQEKKLKYKLCGSASTS